MDKEPWLGLIMRVTRVIGILIRQVGVVNFIILMVTHIRANGTIIKPMVTVITRIRKEPHISAIGSKINSTEKAERRGLRVQFTKVNMKCQRNRAWALIRGLMALNMLVTGSTIKFLASANTFGRMDADISDSG